MPAQRDSQPASTVLDAAGDGQAELTVRSEFVVSHTSVRVGPAPGETRVIRQPRAELLLNGEQFEGSYSGASDQSDTRHLMLPGDTLTCVWTGGDPGATATVRIRGYTYPPGEGIKAV